MCVCVCVAVCWFSGVGVLEFKVFDCAFLSFSMVLRFGAIPFAGEMRRSLANRKSYAEEEGVLAEKQFV